MLHAEAVFDLSRSYDDGSTVRDNLLQVWRTTKKWPKELDYPDLPVQLEHLWTAFVDLRSACSGDSSISYQDVNAYTEFSGVRLDYYEFKLIKRLEALWMKCRNKET